jgi:predicted ATP-binding protein involved in virulence
LDDLKQWLVNMDALSRKEDALQLDRNRVTEVLQKFLYIFKELSEGLDIQSIQITSDFQVMVRTRDGTIPVESLSQGMTSLLSWVGILLQRLYEVNYGDAKILDPTQQYALVLMDEIDAHMHPSWQQALVGKLKKFFPNLQVVASTHSPLVVGGMSVGQVSRFVRDPNGEVILAEIDKEMTLGRADQILTGDLFGLETSLDETTQQEMEKYRELLGKRHRTEKEEEDFQRLRRVIRMRVPMSAETPPERLAQEIVSVVLKEQAGEDFPDASATVLDRVTKLLTEIHKRQTRAQR